jgi:flap endonuclease-1
LSKETHYLTGTVEEMDKFSRRTVKVTREHNEECRRLLGLMGIPFVVAPSEAEAQCAALARDGKVYAAGSEGVELRSCLTFEISYGCVLLDMDTLTFHTPILYRHLTFSEAKKQPISEINLEKALEGLDMDMSMVRLPLPYALGFDTLTVVIPQFIDLCILLGCDYLEPIKGIGPKSALKLIREYKGLGGVVEHLREKCIIFSCPVPSAF